jgi:hypothetical protein
MDGLESRLGEWQQLAQEAQNRYVRTLHFLNV